MKLLIVPNPLCYFKLILSIILFSFISCNTNVDLESIPKTENQEITFEKVSYNELLPLIKNDKIRLNLSSLQRDLTIQLGRGIQIDTLYFTKIVKENEYTTCLN